MGLIDNDLVSGLTDAVAAKRLIQQCYWNTSFDLTNTWDTDLVCRPLLPDQEVSYGIFRSPKKVTCGY